MVAHTCKPSAGEAEAERQRQVPSQGSLVSQPSLVGKLQASERYGPQNKVDSVPEE